MNLFRFQKGFSPVMVINARSGTLLLPEVAEKMTEAGLEKTETDWHLSRILDLPVLESAAMLTANLSPYLIDLSHPLPGSGSSASNALVPTRTRAGEAIYLEQHEPEESEVAKRIEHFYLPFHQQLQKECRRLIDRFGFVVALDFRSRLQNAKDPQAPNESSTPGIQFSLPGNCPSELEQLIQIQVSAATSDDLMIQVTDRAKEPFHLLDSIDSEFAYGISITIDQTAYLDLEDRCIDLPGIQSVMKKLEAILLPVVKWSERQAN